MALATLKLVVPAEPAKKDLADYANAVMNVNNYAYAITQTSMPVLLRPPAHYAEFVERFGPAKQHAIEWSTSIFPQMLALPNLILNAKPLFNLDEGMVKRYLQMLISQPGDAELTAGLRDALDDMRKMLKNQLDAVEKIETNIDKFAAEIKEDAATLSDIAKGALLGVASDKANIELLNQQIKDLNDDIKSRQKWITVSEIGMVLSIFTGLVGAVVAFIPGAQAGGIAMIVIGVAGLGVSTASTIIMEEQIKQDQKLIVENGKTIDALNQDIVALQAVSLQFDFLVEANHDAQNALKTVKATWQELDATLQQVADELTAVDADVTAEQYETALKDLAAADEAWEAVVAFAEALNGIDYKWQDENGDWHNVSDSLPVPDGATVDMIDAA